MLPHLLYRQTTLPQNVLLLALLVPVAVPPLPPLLVPPPMLLLTPPLLLLPPLLLTPPMLVLLPLTLPLPPMAPLLPLLLLSPAPLLPPVLWLPPPLWLPPTVVLCEPAALPSLAVWPPQAEATPIRANNANSGRFFMALISDVATACGTNSISATRRDTREKYHSYYTSPVEDGMAIRSDEYLLGRFAAILVRREAD
jgi:hypothetical protein